MYDDSLELNISTLDPKLDRPKRPARKHADVVVIMPAIYTRLSQSFPSLIVSITITTAPLRINSYTEAQQEQQRTEHAN